MVEKPKEKRPREEKRESIYVGGERDSLKEMTPRHYGRFFNQRLLFIVLAILSIFSLTVLLWTI